VTPRRVLVILIALGLVASGVVLLARVRLEARYRAVEIVLDGDDWATLARREGYDRAQLYRALRARGVTSVALGEATLKRLAEEGAIGYAGGGALNAAGRVAPLAEPLRRLQARGVIRTDAVYIVGSSETLGFVVSRLQALLGAGRVHALDGVVAALGTPEDMEELGLGFRPTDAAAVRASGLEVVLRPRNFRGLTPDSLRVLVESYAATTPEPTLIFALNEVQGYEDLVEDAAAEYRRMGARFGRIEVFTARRKQRGEDRMTALMRPSVIRVFSITPEELLVLRPAEAAARFVRAAQERNIRILYVRPLLATPAGESPIEVNLGMVERITRDLRRFDFTPARSRPLPPLEVPRPVIWVVMVGAVALAVLVLHDLARAIGAPIPAPVVWGLVAVGLLGGIAAGATPFDGLWRQLLGLAVAVAGATGAVVYAIPGPRPRPGGLVIAGWLTLLRAIVLAVIAGVFVAAVLSQWAFMLAFATFLGVKAAHVLPVLLVGLWLGFVRTDGRGWRRTADELGAWISQPLRLGTALAVIVLGLAAVLVLARTGNVSVPLSGVEQQLRTMLEEWLVARPRTKEFLVGYPALVLAGTAAALGWRRAAVPLAMIGAVGTAGAINSFSHLHTPLFYTMWRTGNALLIGALLAIPAVGVLLWVHRRFGRF
jgi:hypothetical protein